MSFLSFKKEYMDVDLWSTAHQKLPASTSSIFKAAKERSWKHAPTPSAKREAELSSFLEPDTAHGASFAPTRNILENTPEEAFDPSTEMGRDLIRRREMLEDNDLMAPPEANAEYGIDGHLSFDEPIPKQAARIMNERKTEEIRRNDVLQRARGSQNVLSFATEMGTQFVDPVNIAASFIPIVGASRTARLTAKHGATKARAITGLVDGAVGNAIVEPAILSAAQQEKADYYMADSLINVAFGGIAGGGLHVVGGKISDAVSGIKKTTHQNNVRRAISQMVDGGVVKVDDVMAKDPNAAVQSGEGVKGPKIKVGGEKAPEGAEKVRLDQVSPPIKRDLLDALKGSDLDSGHQKLNVTEVPMRFDEFSRPVSDQLGTNEGSFRIHEPTGEEWYVKKPETTEHAQNEYLAYLLYRQTGVDVPNVKMVADDFFHDGMSTAGIASKKLPEAQSLTPAMVKTFAQNDEEFLENFVVDAWLGNWDVVASGNTHLTGSKLVRIDHGGALLYRAQGEPKGDAFSSIVEEITTMRDSTNPAGQTVFGDLSPDTLERGAAKVLAVTDQEIKDLVHLAGFSGEQADKLAATLIARREDIAGRFPAASKRAHWQAKKGHKVFFSWEDAVEFIKRNIDRVNSKLTDTQRGVLQKYQGSSYKLNAYLRNTDEIADSLRVDPTLEGKLEDQIEVLDGIMKMHKTPQPIVVYRGIPDYALTMQGMGVNLDMADAVPKNIIGHVIEDDAFVSTSLSPKSAAGASDVIMRIEVPEGYGAVFADAHKPAENISMDGFIKGEQELILDRGSKFVVTDAWRSKNTWGGNQLTVSVKAIPRNVDKQGFISRLFVKNTNPWFTQNQPSHAADPEPLPEVKNLDTASIVRGTDSHGHEKGDFGNGPKIPGEERGVGKAKGDAVDDSGMNEAINDLSKQYEEMKTQLEDSPDDEFLQDMISETDRTLQEMNDIVKTSKIKSAVAKAAAKCGLGN